MNQVERKYGVDSGERPTISIEPVPEHLGPLHDRFEKFVRKLITKTSRSVLIDVAVIIAAIIFVVVMSQVLGNAHFLADHVGSLK